MTLKDSQGSLTMSKTLFDPNLMCKASQEVTEIRTHSREHCFQNVSDGEFGKEILKRLKQYMNILLRQVKNRLNRHSKYFLIYHFRRILAIHRLLLAEKFDWKQEDLNAFTRELSWIAWLYDRITLAVLKYGTSKLDDMKIPPSKVKGTSGYVFPNQLTSNDIVDLYATLFLIWEYEETRYCMKRAGKGGKFVWTNRAELEFDIVLESDIQNLVNIFDDRVTSIGNLLSFSGTWAPIIISNEFPLPSSGGAYTTIMAAYNTTVGPYTTLHIWPKAVSTTAALLDDEPVVLTLLPNIGGQGNNLGWRDPLTNQLIPSPPWIFRWYHLNSMLPRLELFRGVVKKHLEFSGRPMYEPEDLVFALAAITQHQIKLCREDNPSNNPSWYQIFSFGYSIWTEPYELLKQRMLPEYRNLRKKYRGVSPSKKDWVTLKSVIEDIKWDEKKYEKIDILRFSPVNFIFPIDKNTWLIDWSLMLDVILDLTGPYGRMIGTIAMLRGRELEKALTEYFQFHMDTLGISLWWLGQGAKNKVKFYASGERDVDIGLIVNNHLLILEIKAYAGRRDLLLVGNPECLSERWENRIKPAIHQVDTLSERLSKEPEGKNFKIPREVKWVVPIVCGPFTEWIPSSDSKWWLYHDIPRVCTPNEVLEIITRIENGDLPQYKLPISRNGYVKSKVDQRKP